MNDVDFPVADVLAGIDAGRPRGLAPIKINMVVKRGVNDHEIVPMARHFRGSGHIAALHRVHGRRQHQRLAHGRRRARRAKSCGGSARAFPLEPVEPNYAGEVAERWRYRRRRRRDRRDLVGDPAVLPRLHAGAPVDRGPPLHLPVRHAAARSARPAARRLRRRSRSPRRSARSGAARADRYSELRSGQTAGLRKIEMSYIGG